jgi:CMP-N,N'-diacetyllegionaminic acid synthase
MRVLAVVPARCGSKRIPHKNLEKVDNQTLVDRAILSSDTELVTSLVVSTDCPLVAARIAAGYGESLVFERSCGSDGPMVDVMLEVLREFGPGLFDAILCLQPTSPFRLPEDISTCIATMEALEDVDAVVTIDAETRQRNGGVYLVRTRLLRDGLMWNDQTAKVEVPHERSLDINTPEDLELARRIAKEKGW